MVEHLRLVVPAAGHADELSTALLGELRCVEHADGLARGVAGTRRDGHVLHLSARPEVPDLRGGRRQ